MSNSGRIRLLESIGIILIPIIIFTLQRIIPSVIWILVSIGVFYILAGLLLIRTIYGYSIRLLTNLKDTTKELNLIEMFVFSASFGVGLNILLTLIAINIWNIELLQVEYILIFSIFGISNYILKFKNLKIRIIHSFIIDSILIVATLVPTIILISISFINSPFPYMTGWDIFSFLQNAGQIISGNITTIYADHNIATTELPYAMGFSFVLVNILTTSGLDFIYIIEIVKIGLFFSFGLSSLWMFVLVLRTTNSVPISIIGSLALSSFNGLGFSLDPRYFLPSSVAWLFGVGAFYVLHAVYGRKEKFLLLTYFSIMMIIFHLYTAILMIGFLMILIMFSRLKTNYQAMSLVMILAIEAILILSDISINIPTLGTPIDSAILLGSSIKFFPILIPLIVIPYSIYQIKQKGPFSEIFMICLILYPALVIQISGIYRIGYLTAIVSAFAFSQFINKVISRGKSRSIQQKNIITFLVIFLVVGSLLMPMFGERSNQDPLIEASNGIFVKSQYSESEINAIFWMSRYLPESTIIVSDPGLARIAGGLSGHPSLMITGKDNISQEIKECMKTGIDEGYVNVFEIKQVLKQLLGNNTFENYVLILSPRTHYWIVSNTNVVYGFKDQSVLDYRITTAMLNTTDLENIYNDNNQTMIFLGRL